MAARFLLRALPSEGLAATSRIPPTSSSLTAAVTSSPSSILPRFASTSTARAFKPAASQAPPALTRKERRPHPQKNSIATPRPSDRIRGPYFVNRTPSKLLPIYSKPAHNGAQVWTTLVRKIDGDAHTLREELVEVLGTPEIQVRSVTNHLLIKGQHKEAVVEYLQSKGF